jgi:hypothetical protein
MSTTAVYSHNPIAPSDFDRFGLVGHEKAQGIPSYLVSQSQREERVEFSTIESPFEKIAPHSSNVITHPEGCFMYYRDNVVSPQPVGNAHLVLADEIICGCETWVAAADTTVFLDLKGTRVDYYVATNQPKTIVWASGQLPESFQDTTSTKRELEYWAHTENFPGPRFATEQDLQLLRNTLASYAIDAATSEGSTSPMSVLQIQMHLRTLDSFDTSGVHQTYAIGECFIRVPSNSKY